MDKGPQHKYHGYFPCSRYHSVPGIIHDDHEQHQQDISAAERASQVGGGHLAGGAKGQHGAV